MIARTRRKPHLPYGFTLVELLVAIFIAAIALTMGYGAINAALEHRGEIEARQARLLEVQTAMRVLVQDFSQLAPRPVRDAIGDNLLPALQGVSTGQPFVTFTRSGWANPAGIQRPALQRVSYVFENGTLRREHWPVLDATQGSEPIRRELLTRVRSVKIRYTNDGRQWLDQWPSLSTSAVPADNPLQLRQRQMRMLPAAVEISIDLEDWGQITRLVEVAR